MVHNYVRMRYKSESDTAMSMVVHHLVERKDSLAVKDPLKLIVEDIYISVKDDLDSKYTREVISKVLSKPGHVRLVNEHDYELILHNYKNGKYGYDLKADGYVIHASYKVYRIDDDDLCYIVPLHVVAPFEDCDLIERLYHDYFTDYETALTYFRRHNKVFTPAYGSKESSGYRVFAFSKKELLKNSWYKENMQFMEMYKQYREHLDLGNYMYHTDMTECLDLLRKDAFDYFDADAYRNMMMLLFGRIGSFLSTASKSRFNERFNDSSVDARKLIFTMILVAFAEADSPDKFDSLRDAFGNFDFLIDCVTDDIYNAHDDGGILVTKAGEIAWFDDDDTYALCQWVGAQDSSPFYDKNMPNTSDTLLCLSEYHPELFLDRLPTETDVRVAHKQMTEKRLEKKKRHLELRTFGVKTPDDQDGFWGKWYYAGIESDRSVDITVPKKYYNIELTREEMCSLLNNEETVLHGYIPRSGGEPFDIRGVLAQVDKTEKGAIIQYIRTDIDLVERSKIDQSLGVQVEKGLPPSLNDGGSDDE